MRAEVSIIFILPRSYNIVVVVDVVDRCCSKKEKKKIFTIIIINNNLVYHYLNMGQEWHFIYFYILVQTYFLPKQTTTTSYREISTLNTNNTPNKIIFNIKPVANIP